jgi:hypothetical protein
VPAFPWASILPWLFFLLMLLILAALLVILLFLLFRWVSHCRRENLTRRWADFWRFVAATLAGWWQVIVGRWQAFVGGARRAWAWLRRKRPTSGGLPQDRFADIFRDRALAESLTPAQITTHVYEAFLAYAELIGSGRKTQETPLEYLRRLPEKVQVQPDDARTLTNLYVQASYTPNELTGDHVGVLRAIWQRLQAPIDEALQAHKAAARLIRQRA